jgi:hypothetical protein
VTAYTLGQAITPQGDDTMIRDLTTAETSALHAFAAKFGRSWKDKLASVYWYNARIWNDQPCLHALRNDPSWGHEGLQAYRLVPKAGTLAATLGETESVGSTTYRRAPRLG